MEGTAESPLRWHRLASAAAVGALIGSALTALAVAPMRTGFETRTDLRPESPGLAREWPKRPLDREWRDYRTPVDVDRMFRSLEHERP